MHGMDGVFLKTSKVFVETAAAFIVEAVAVVTQALVVVKLGGGPSIRHVDHVGATLPPQCRLTAGRGDRLAV